MQDNPQYSIRREVPPPVIPPKPQVVPHVQRVSWTLKIKFKKNSLRLMVAKSMKTRDQSMRRIAKSNTNVLNHQSTAGKPYNPFHHHHNHNQSHSSILHVMTRFQTVCFCLNYFWQSHTLIISESISNHYIIPKSMRGSSSPILVRVQLSSKSPDSVRRVWPFFPYVYSYFSPHETFFEF